MIGRMVRRGPLLALGACVLVGAFALGPSPARAEAPHFYDSLGPSALYDPEFFPMNRIGPLVSILVQGWSRPDAGVPRQAPFDQNYEQQYRLLVNLGLDPRYSLLVELKGDSRDQVVGDDYFLKTEFFYQGLEAPLFVYGGMRMPEETDFLVYGGIESMSYAPRDLIPPLEADIPVAVRGFAEVRYDMDDNDPTLRLYTMLHTLPVRFAPTAVMSVGLDSRFQERVGPRWILDAHLEYRLPLGMIRPALVTGYALDLEDGGEQRLSLGLQTDLF